MTKTEVPPINWFGGFMTTRELLKWSKGAVDDEENSESFVLKMNRFNFVARVNLVMAALNQFGPTVEAAQAIQGGGKGFFTDHPAEVLAQKLSEVVVTLGGNGVYKFSPKEFGTLDFESVPGGELPGAEPDESEESWN